MSSDIHTNQLKQRMAMASPRRVETVCLVKSEVWEGWRAWRNTMATGSEANRRITYLAWGN